jgi:hypothetical protein
VRRAGLARGRPADHADRPVGLQHRKLDILDLNETVLADGLTHIRRVDPFLIDRAR